MCFLAEIIEIMLRNADFRPQGAFVTSPNPFVSQHFLLWMNEIDCACVPIWTIGPSCKIGFDSFIEQVMVIYYHNLCYYVGFTSNWPLFSWVLWHLTLAVGYTNRHLTLPSIHCPFDFHSYNRLFVFLCRFAGDDPWRHTKVAHRITIFYAGSMSCSARLNFLNTETLFLMRWVIFAAAIINNDSKLQHCFVGAHYKISVKICAMM